MAKAMVLTKENVLATMAGRKRMTRRIINPQPKTDKSILCTMIDTTSREDGKYRGWNYWAEYEDICEVKGTRTKYFKPRYQVGDEVYVAEGYQIQKANYKTHRKSGIYLADKKPFDVTLTDREFDLWMARKQPFSPTSGRFFYKSLARTFMKIVEVRVERLWDISESDCIAEGVIPKDLLPCSPYEIFATLWKTIHGPGAWKLNPWVWVYSWKLGDK